MYYEIPLDVAAQYHIAPLQQYFDDFGETTDTYLTYLQTFLIQTADVENNAMYYVISGQQIPDDINNIVNIKQVVRKEIDKQMGVV